MEENFFIITHIRVCSQILKKELIFDKFPAKVGLSNMLRVMITDQICSRLGTIIKDFKIYFLSKIRIFWKQSFGSYEHALHGEFPAESASFSSVFSSGKQSVNSSNKIYLLKLSICIFSL
ncbi:hypothetical protein [Silvanigrella sp.]|jgi:hypothetical protein|uniref:hypothetical protein n=1 Tax=Silvanigrella sp. TaxID=2024976 RepID=UPI0037C702FB